MTTITRERLEWLSNISGRDDIEDIGGDEIRELARIALASLEAEPVAYTEKCEITNMQATGLYLRGFPNNSQGRDIALFTAPPAPVVPEEKRDEDGNTTSEFDHGWNACRAALLQGSQPVSNRDELPEEKGASLQLRNLTGGAMLNGRKRPSAMLAPSVH